LLNSYEEEGFYAGQHCNRSIRNRISENIVLLRATSAIWNATCRSESVPFWAISTKN